MEERELTLQLGQLMMDIASKVKDGDLSDLEAMLVHQAYALNALFARLARKGMGIKDDKAAARVLDSALKAQKQSQQIVRTLSEMHNPRRTQFVKQQLNQLNLMNSDAPMDTGSPEIAGSENPPMEALGKQHRANDGGRKAEVESECMETWPG